MLQVSIYTSGRKLSCHFPDFVYKRSWSYMCPSFYVRLGFYTQLHKIQCVSHGEEICDTLKLNYLEKKNSILNLP